MLKGCIDALRSQTHRLDLILVVDNDSTDGTREWLAEQTDVRTLLQKNVGGAGGFHVGMKTTHDAGYDWIWCMDDDGWPAHDCLEQLLEANRPNFLYRAPLVLDRENHEALAFVLELPDSNVRLTSRVEAEAAARDGFLDGLACPFNGILMHRRLMDTIGFSLADMFMWGDEVEYFLRTKKAGITMSTCVRAIHFHPRNRMKTTDFHCFGRNLSVIHPGNLFRDYLVARNYAYIARAYSGWWKGMRHTARYTLFYLLTFGPKAALRAFRACVEGMLGLLTGHRRYLSDKP
jgi:rhamnopyranosyl-N-acetylglucosaminyl-diphospho-decaprenol beta-1,3/1,4-galactofuranosyltransferase